VVSTELSTLLAQLRSAGENPPRELLDAIVARGQEAVPPLMALATDELLYLLDDDVPDIWSPYHAIRLLGELRATEAIGPLLTLLEQDDDYLDTYLPESLGSMGGPAVEPLRTTLFDSRVDAYGAGRATRALTKIAEDEPALRDQIVGILTERLDAESSREDQFELRGFLVSELADLRAVESTASIYRAFDEELLDEMIIDRETVDVLLARPEGMSPHDAMAPLVNRDMATSGRGWSLDRVFMPPGDSDDPSEESSDWEDDPVLAPARPFQPETITHASLPFGRKVGRNEPCPCGSGAKFKRCCGR
jgi:hypothetical protein